jgi:hypothetical protein
MFYIIYLSVNGTITIYDHFTSFDGIGEKGITRVEVSMRLASGTVSVATKNKQRKHRVTC